ncbi:MAG: cyclase family protein [Actinomycetota bacterium]|nr:cyclase family protein [Actinomycetota bacterium]
MGTGNWGRWGREDEAGALNLIGESQVLRAAGLVSRGRVIRLGQQLGPASAVPPHRQRVERYMTRDGGDYAAGARRPGGFQFAEDVVAFATHSGTHVDALAHAWYDDELYNGFSSTTVRSTTGAQRCGAEHLRPMVTRGVLLDVAASRDVPLEPEGVVTAGDLAAAAQAAGVTPEPGDAVLIRTGWMARAGSDPGTYYAGEPGIDVSAARWLAEADVAVVGADNYAVEVQPSAPGTVFPVHQLLMRDHGVPLIENVVLEELVEEGAKSFLFVAAPLPLVGSTAGPVCPLAVL